uniref:Uncharacterized protein n=1 Tax=Chelydra serpentina TaxID=8475 RepID=A0A8C3RXB5_CHESE
MDYKLSGTSLPISACDIYWRQLEKKQTQNFVFKGGITCSTFPHGELNKTPTPGLQTHLS